LHLRTSIFLKERAGCMAGVLCLLLALSVAARAERPPSPFTFSPRVHAVSAGSATVRVQVGIPPEHVLYSDRLKFLNDDGDDIVPSRIPNPVIAVDKFDGHEKGMHTNSFEAELIFPSLPTNLVVKFQGCSNSACYFPDKRSFHITQDGVTASVMAPPVIDVGKPPSTWVAAVKDFKLVARETGYMSAGKFIAFLDKSVAGTGMASEDPVARYKNLGILATVVLILAGGMALNLTPCVLPLIPINLAIIHGGRAAQSRREGFLHGAAYGTGMALTYGVLGLVVVLTGSKFGTLNSSMWFNIAIALVFVVLALAMFDVFHIDFARMDWLLGRREARTARGKKSQWLVAFALGAVAALLAGACVAPVVITVLLLAANSYSQGAVIGLALPFLLGVGMALPWPFMGASLSFLPKPGKWMTWVKYSFGALIFLFAAYYGHTAYGIFKTSRAATALSGAPSFGGAAPANDSDQALAEALHDARRQDRPLFIDFAASWCKNCVAMDETVFNQDEVKDRLREFVVVRYAAEKPNEHPAREVLDYFRVIGLPTYVVLRPHASSVVRPRDREGPATK
jgi:thiol:disulfide interchange protein